MPASAQLPGGGRRIFPDYRVVAFYGAPQDDALGALGIGTPDEAAAALVGRPLTAETIARAADLAAAAAQPRSDHRGSADYKRHLAQVLCRRALTQAAGLS